MSRNQRQARQSRPPRNSSNRHPAVSLALYCKRTWMQWASCMVGMGWILVIYLRMVGISQHNLDHLVAMSNSVASSYTTGTTSLLRSSVIVGGSDASQAGMVGGRPNTNPMMASFHPKPLRYTSKGDGSDLYQPAPAESYIMKNLQQLQMTKQPPEWVETCQIWKNPTSTPYFTALHAWVSEMVTYFDKLLTYNLPPNLHKDIRQSIRLRPDQQEGVCQQLELHPDGLRALFHGSNQVSKTPSGWIEPLLPPMRHPGICLEDNVNGISLDTLMSLQYLIHDWAGICRILKPHSRTVFVDMGASLSFHPGSPTPVFKLLNQYRRFGIVFDHIYAYEITFADPNAVFPAIPPQFQSAFHWINVGVQADPTHVNNPYRLLLENFHEDDFIVVKLDIDTEDKALEGSLVDPLLSNPQLAKLVDHFYFEHHVNQEELSPHWGETSESVEESFHFFSALREKGIAAHFWV